MTNPSKPPPLQFGVSSLLLITTLAAVVMSVSVIVPGLGIVLAVLAVPALIRTYMVVRRSREDGKPASTKEKVVLFLACLGIATLIAVAASAAFFVACFAGFAVGTATPGRGWDPRNIGLIAGTLLGLAAGMSVLILLLVKWFKRPIRRSVLATKPESPAVENPPGGNP